MRPYYKYPTPKTNNFKSPVTISVMIIWLIMLILELIKVPVDTFIGISSGNIIPTAFITYSLIPSGIIGAIFAAMTLYFIGKNLEDTWGSKKYLIFLIIISFSGSIFYETGAILFGGGIQDLANPWKIVSGIIIAWAFMYPHERISFWFIPVPSFIIIIITMIMEYLMNAPRANPEAEWLQIFCGFFALGSVLFAWLFVKYQYIFNRKNKLRSKSTSSNFFINIIHEIERRRRIAELRRKFRFSDEDDK
jgi:membrane associated rhomboid family serine protease